MLKHIVVWKLKESAEGADRKANAQKMKAMLEALPPKIPQIKQFEVGINFIPSDAAYDMSLYSAFDSEQDLEIYLKHPDHVKVAEFITKVREGRVVVDYKS